MKTCIDCNKPCSKLACRCKICSNKYRAKMLYINDPFDKTITPHNMYFWGFLWADGYISKKQNRVSLEIAKKDFDNIKYCIPTQFNVYYRQQKNRQEQGNAICGRADIYNFFVSKGYDNKQTPDNALINSKLSRCWFLGVIDGDGSWYYNAKNNCTQFNLSSNYYQNWEFFSSLLDNLGCKYKIHRIVTKKKHKHSYIRMCCRRNITKLFNYLYPNEFEFGLYRKYVKGKLIVNSY